MLTQFYSGKVFLCLLSNKINIGDVKILGYFHKNTFLVHNKCFAESTSSALCTRKVLLRNKGNELVPDKQQRSCIPSTKSWSRRQIRNNLMNFFLFLSSALLGVPCGWGRRSTERVTFNITLLSLRHCILSMLFPSFADRCCDEQVSCNSRDLCSYK